MRSQLFVPGDSAAKLGKAFASGADCLFIDLEDAVAPAAKPAARLLTADFLGEMRAKTPRPALYVRVNSFASGLLEADLAAIMPAAPDGLVLPKAGSGADLQRLGAKLAVHEAEIGLPDGATRIVALTETAAALFTMGSFIGASRRLAGLAWGAEDLMADLGAETNQMPDGAWTPPFALLRSLALFAARAACVAPIDTVYPAFRDQDGLRAVCEAARRDGFAGKMAVHPAQIPIINAVFTPSPEALAEAQAVVDAFAADPARGVRGEGGAMLDAAHLRRAQLVLAQAAALKR